MKRGNFFRLGLPAVLTLIFAVSALAEEIKVIHIATPSWEGHTNKDGTGLLFEMVRKIYEPAGIKMEYEFVPWKRAESMLENKKADAMLYAALQNVVLAPKYPLTIDYLSVVFRKDNIKEWKGPGTLNGRTAVWMRGYDYDKNPRMKDIKLKNWDEIDSHKQAWEMLNKGRMDFYVDALVDINLYISKNKIDMTPYQVETLWGEKVYMVFAKTEQSEKLIEIYDRRVIELFNSGELKKLFEKWNNKYSPEAWEE